MDLTFHGTDEQLEMYALGRLPEAGLSFVEDHLIVCGSCRDRLDVLEAFALGMREALESDFPAPPETSRAGEWFAFLRKPAFSLAFGFALLVLIGTAFVTGGHTKLAPAVALQLTAMRGGMPSALPARETDLILLDVAQETGAPESGPFKVAVVDSSGKSLWTGTAESVPQGVAIRIGEPLSPGTYFVRLHAAGGQVIHEYGFRVHAP